LGRRFRTRDYWRDYWCPGLLVSVHFSDFRGRPRRGGLGDYWGDYWCQFIFLTFGVARVAAD
jgi:hypothetical protein